MDLNNYFVFDGEKSSDLDTYIAGEGTFNAPERVYTMQNIPGRNGQIALDEGRFENYELKYPAFIFTSAGADFRRKISDLRNALLSKKGYKRLTDTYHPDEYRLAIYREGLETKPVQYNRAGEFDLVFDCKPQRFLLEGEVPISYPKSPTGLTTINGEYLTVDNTAGNQIVTDLKQQVSPVLDDNGYGSVWAPGMNPASVGCLPRSLQTAGTITDNGVTWTWISETSYSVEGYAGTGGANLVSDLTASSPDARPIPAGNYRLMSKNGSAQVLIGPADGSSDMLAYNVGALEGGYYRVSFTVPTGNDYVYIINIHYNASHGNNDTFVAPVIVVGNTYKPYVNQGTFKKIENVELHQTGKNLATVSTITSNSRGAVPTTAVATLPEDGRYTLSFVMNRSYESLYVYGTSVTYGQFSANSGGRKTLSFNGLKNSVVKFSAVDRAFAADSDVIASIQVEKADSATEYEPYVWRNYPVDIASARTYGGEVNYLTKRYSDAYGLISFNMSAYTVTYESSYSDENSACFSLVYYMYSYAYSGLISDIGLIEQPNILSDMTVEGFLFRSSENKVYFRFNRSRLTDTTAEALKNYLPATLVFCEKKSPGRTNTYPIEVDPLQMFTALNNFSADGEELTITYGTNQNKITNPTQFPARPLLEITGNGTIWIGEYLITIGGSPHTVIDCETMEAYDGLTSKNKYVEINKIDFPVLNAGDTNIIVGYGISSLVITPRWWKI